MLVGVIPLTVAMAAQAVSIGGSIQFLGSATMNGGQTGFVSFHDQFGGGLGPTVQTVTGSYGAVTIGTTAAWTPFTFNPPTASVTPLWSFSLNSTTYSFDATSMNVTWVNANTLNIQGTGIAHITGFQDTVGTWTVTSTGSGTTFTFGALTQSGDVPDGGTTVLLLGGALSGLALLRKRFA